MISSIQKNTSSHPHGSAGSASLGDFGNIASLNISENSDLDEFEDTASVSTGGVFSEVDGAVTAALRKVGSHLSPSDVDKLRNVLTTLANNALC